MSGAPFAIREETQADREAVLAIDRAAFSGNVEADLVARLYADGEVIVGLVAESEGSVTGHILFSRLPIALATGETVAAAALGPLAVLPAKQRQGIGSALVREGLARCRASGIAAVVVLGDPAYYARFGFSTELAGRLQSPWSGPYLMAVELAMGSLADGAGSARYADAFLALER